MSLVMDRYDALEERSAGGGPDADMRFFSPVFFLSQFFGALMVIFVAIWMGRYGDGFGWGEANPDGQFSYHPLFMSIGMVFLFGEAILVYRVFRNEKKKFTKLLHGVLHGMVLVFVVVALKAVFDSHNNHVNDQGEPAPLPNLFTFHGWIGLTLVIAFVLQLAFGFLVFVWPGGSPTFRGAFLSLHTKIGLTLFVIAAGTAVVGIAERSAWHVKCWGERCAAGIYVNLLAICMLAYAGCVFFLVASDKYKRKPLPEEQSLHPLTTED